MKINPDDSIIVIYKNPGDKDLTFGVNRSKGYLPEQYGTLICYLVDHVAQSCSVPADAIWKAVEKARRGLESSARPTK